MKDVFHYGSMWGFIFSPLILNPMWNGNFSESEAAQAYAHMSHLTAG